MVVRGFRQVPYRVHQHERRRPPVRLVDAANPPVLEVPPGKLAQPLGDLRFVVGWLFFRHGRQLPTPNSATPDWDTRPDQRRSFGRWSVWPLGAWECVYMPPPPPPKMPCRVTKPAAGEPRNTATPATSSGVPQRASGV